MKQSSSSYVSEKKIQCIILSETYAIEDCYYYDPQTSDKSRYSVQTGGATISYGTNGCTITGTRATDTYVRNTALSLPSEYEATFIVTARNGEVQGSKSYYGGVCFDDWFTDWKSTNESYTYKLSTVTALSTNFSKLNANDVIKVVRENNTMKLYMNDTLVATDNNINHTGYFQYRTYKISGKTGRSLTIKDLKIKPL